MLSCSTRFSAPSFWMGGGLEGRCLGRVCGADGADEDDLRIQTCWRDFKCFNRNKFIYVH
jgi:hypothetical protein